MKKYFFIFVIMNFAVLGKSQIEGETITIHQVQIGMETSTLGGGSGSTVAMQMVELLKKPIKLKLKELKPNSVDGIPFAPGTFFVADYVKEVTLENVLFEFKLEAAVQVLDGKTSPYVVGVSYKEKSDRFSKTVAMVSTKSIEGMNEVLSTTAWAKDRILLDSESKKVGQIRVILDINKHEF